jgi:general secretion pathway protein G
MTRGSWFVRRRATTKIERQYGTLVGLPGGESRLSQFSFCARSAQKLGFTLIEVLLVITIIGILLTLAQPSYQRAVTAAKEATLKENLFVLRDLLDQYYADNTRYPESLSELVERRYLRRVPKDPITGSSDTWVAVYATDEQGQQAGIFDVKSGSQAVASDGTRYSDW